MVLIHTKWAISDATDRILEFWLQILNLHKKLVRVTYSMSYYSMVSVVPFLVIIILFAPAGTADQIWWCPLQIPHFCGISHPLTYKSSLVEQGVRSPPNNLYCLNYYLTINPNDVQITWRTPWLKSDWTLMSGQTNWIKPAHMGNLSSWLNRSDCISAEIGWHA